jgi:DTW domain-containing protein
VSADLTGKPPEQPWEHRCPGCFLLPVNCICSRIPRLQTQTRVWIVRHTREHRKTTNTARLAHRALANSHMLTYGDREYPLNVDRLPEQGYLLFPAALDQTGLPSPNGPPVYDLSRDALPAPCADLVILDGTWSQARRMSHRLTRVATLPRLTFSEVPARARVRRPPHPGTLATLEAIAHALWYLENPACGEALLQVFDSFVEAYNQQCNKPPKNCRSKEF